MPVDGSSKNMMGGLPIRMKLKLGFRNLHYNSNEKFSVPKVAIATYNFLLLPPEYSPASIS